MRACRDSLTAPPGDRIKVFGIRYLDSTEKDTNLRKVACRTDECATFRDDDFRQ